MAHSGLEQQYEVGDYVYVQIDEKTMKRSGQGEWSQVGQVWDVLTPKNMPGRNSWKYRVRLVSWCVNEPGYPALLVNYRACELKRASKRTYDSALDEVAGHCVGLIPGETAYERQGSQCDKVTILIGPFSRIITQHGYKRTLIDVEGTVIDADKLHYRWGHGITGVFTIAQVAGRPPRKVRIERTEVPPAALFAQRHRREWPRFQVNARPER